MHGRKFHGFIVLCISLCLFYILKTWRYSRVLQMLLPFTMKLRTRWFEGNILVSGKLCSFMPITCHLMVSTLIGSGHWPQFVCYLCSTCLLLWQRHCYLTFPWRLALPSQECHENFPAVAKIILDWMPPFEVFLRTGTMLDSGKLVNNVSKFVIKGLQFLRIWFEIIARYGPCLRVPWTTEDRNASECCIEGHYLLSGPSQRIKSVSVTRIGQIRFLWGIICFDFVIRTKLKTRVTG